MSSPVVVGRTEELELLLDAASESPAVAFVEGEAGIGKTRLVHELPSLPALAGHRVLVGHCHRLREPSPLGPFIEGLRTLSDDPPTVTVSPVVGDLRPFLPELADWLPPRQQPFGDPRIDQDRLARALHEILDALGPTLLVLEDLHWADAGSLELLERLVSRPPAGLSLILTYRREELDAASPLLALATRLPPAASRILVPLAPLDVQGVLALTQAILQTDAVAERFAEDLHTWTAGIPFAVEEAIHLFLDRGQLVSRGGQWTARERQTLAVPPALRDTLLHRLGGLSGDAKLTVQASAVIGLPASEQLLSYVADLSESRTRTALLEALAATLLHEMKGGHYGLRHALAGQAVYEAIAGPTRRLLHLRAARALESGPDPLPLAQLTHHFREAQRQPQWIDYAERAADAYAAVGDDQGAVRLLQDVFSASCLSCDVRVRLATKLANAALFGRVPQHAIPIIEQILSEDLPVDVRGELRFSLARLLSLVCDIPSAYREMMRAADELRARPGLAARAMANLAAASPSEGKQSDQLLWINRAIEAAERQGDTAVTIEILGSRAELLLEAGNPAGWQAVEEIPWDAGSAKDKLELVRVCKYLAMAALLLGYHRRAESFLEQADRMRHELRHERFGVGLGTVKLELEWSTGRWHGLEARAHKLVGAAADAPCMAATSRLVIAQLQLSRGELDEAERGFASAIDVFEEARAGSCIAEATAGLAVIYLGRGAARKARDVANVGLRYVREHGRWTWGAALIPVVVDALLACGQGREARVVVTEFERGLRGLDAPAAKAAIRLCRGALAESEGRWVSAGRSFAQAERAWRGAPSPYAAARAKERGGRALLAEDKAQAAERLLGALDEYERLGARWDACRTKRVLRAHDALPWRGGRRSYGAQLSPRELEVAELAASGRTNPEIADLLVISPRTVEKHVASAIRKLGAPSRKHLRTTLRT